MNYRHADRAKLAICCLGALATAGASLFPVWRISYEQRILQRVEKKRELTDAWRNDPNKSPEANAKLAEQLSRDFDILNPDEPFHARSEYRRGFLWVPPKWPYTDSYYLSGGLFSVDPSGKLPTSQGWREVRAQDVQVATDRLWAEVIAVLSATALSIATLRAVVR